MSVEKTILELAETYSLKYLNGINNCNEVCELKEKMKVHFLLKQTECDYDVKCMKPVINCPATNCDSTIPVSCSIVITELIEETPCNRNNINITAL